MWDKTVSLHKFFDTVIQICNWSLQIVDTVRKNFEKALQIFCLFQTKLWLWVQVFYNWDKTVDHLIHFLTLLEIKVILAAKILVLWDKIWIQLTKTSKLWDKFVIHPTNLSALWDKKLKQLTNSSTIWHDVSFHLSSFLTLRNKILLHITFLTSWERLLITATFLRHCGTKQHFVSQTFGCNATKLWLLSQNCWYCATKLWIATQNVLPFRLKLWIGSHFFRHCETIV